jgi:hypothetical protein
MGRTLEGLLTVLWVAELLSSKTFPEADSFREG